MFFHCLLVIRKPEDRIGKQCVRFKTNKRDYFIKCAVFKLLNSLAYNIMDTKILCLGRQVLVSTFHGAFLSTELSVFVIKLEAGRRVQKISLLCFFKLSPNHPLHITVKDKQFI